MKTSSSRGRVTRFSGTMVIVSLVSGLSSFAAVAQTAIPPAPPGTGVTPAPATTQPVEPAAPNTVHLLPAAITEAEKAQREAWRIQMLHAPRKKGACYTANYPDTQWHEVPCKAPPHHVSRRTPGRT